MVDPLLLGTLVPLGISILGFLRRKPAHIGWIAIQVAIALYLIFWVPASNDAWSSPVIGHLTLAIAGPTPILDVIRSVAFRKTAADTP